MLALLLLADTGCVVQDAEVLLLVSSHDAAVRCSIAPPAQHPTTTTTYARPTSAGMFYSHRKSGQPGPITRIMCCTPEEYDRLPVGGWHAARAAGFLPCGCLVMVKRPTVLYCPLPAAAHCCCYPVLLCASPRHLYPCTVLLLPTTLVTASQAADRDLVPTHVAPSYTHHPRNGDTYSAYNKPVAIIDW